MIVTIAKFLKQNNIKEQEIATALGVSRQYINAIVKGRKNASQDFFDYLEQRTGEKLEYLLPRIEHKKIIKYNFSNDN